MWEPPEARNSWFFHMWPRANRRVPEYFRGVEAGRLARGGNFSRQRPRYRHPPNHGRVASLRFLRPAPRWPLSMTGEADDTRPAQGSPPTRDPCHDPAAYPLRRRGRANLASPRGQVDSDRPFRRDRRNFGDESTQRRRLPWRGNSSLHGRGGLHRCDAPRQLPIGIGAEQGFWRR